MLYQQNILQLEAQLVELNRTNRLIVIGKLLLVAGGGTLAYFWLSAGHVAFLYGALGCIGLFAALFKYDLRFMKKLRLTRKLVEVNQNEIKALEANMEPFDGGGEFSDAAHDYTFDLDIFSTGGLFRTVNRTVTQEGKQQLAAMVQRTDVAPHEITERQGAVAQLKGMVDWRLRFVAIGSLERLSLAGIVAHFGQADKIAFKPWMKAVGFVLIAAVLTSLAGHIAGWWGAGIWLVPFFTNLLVVGAWLKRTNAVYGKLNGAYKSIDKYHDLLVHIHTAQNQLTAPRLKEVVDTLVQTSDNSLAAFADLKKLLGRFDQRSNILVTVALNGFLLSDLRLLVRYDRWIDRYGAKLSDYQNAIAQMDAYVSLANFAYNNPRFVVPQLCDDDGMHAVALGHPLIAESQRVCSDFSVAGAHRFFVTTGANMAGKSTFLRTVGVNMVLAACGAPVCAESFVYRPVALFSSMRASDNLVNHVSYFQAELLRLQSLVDQARTGRPLFVILDEILKGTNSKDKLAGSRLFLLKMLQYNVSGIIATHDLALGDLAIEHPDHFQNICFEVDITDDSLYFSYKLQNGVAQNMNATWLLNRMLGEMG